MEIDKKKNLIKKQDKKMTFYKNQNRLLTSKGSFLIELLTAVFLFSIVSATVGAYFLKFLTENNKIQNYIKQEDYDKMIKLFFENEKNCTATLRGRRADINIDKLQTHVLFSNPPVHRPFEAYEDFKRKNSPIELNIKPLKGHYGLAVLKYKTRRLDLETGKPLKPKSFSNKQVSFFVSLNEDKSVNECLLRADSQPRCPAGYKNVIFFSNQSLTPFMYEEIEESQPNGASYRRTVSQHYGPSPNQTVECNSSLFCNYGEWISNISCYDSCRDSVWSLGDSEFQPVQASSLAQKTDAKNKWCPSQRMAAPSISFDMNRYCHQLAQSSDWTANPNNYSARIKRICRMANPRYSSPATWITIPQSDFNQIREVTTPVNLQIKTNVSPIEIGRASLFFRCEYTGFFSALSQTADQKKTLRVNSNDISATDPVNVWGRDSQCLAKYITQTAVNERSFLCHVDEKVKLCDPDDSSFCFERPLRSLYPNRSVAFRDYIPQGLPIRFNYNYSETDRGFFAYYTVMCDKKNFCGRNKKTCLPYRSSNSGFRVIQSEKSCSRAAEKPQLDMLFVIDDSGSMADNQINLKRNLPAFLDEFLKPDLELDYHFAVMGTDRVGLSDDNYICQNCSTGNHKIRVTNITIVKRVLKRKVQVGAYGGNERSFSRPMKLYRDYGQAGRDFYRKNSTLAIIFLTDEGDQSWKNGDHRIHKKLIDDFIGTTLRKRPDKVLIYSIRPWRGFCGGGEFPQPGFDEMEQLAQSRGYYVDKLDLCQSQWSNDLRDFGRQIRNSLFNNAPLNDSFNLPPETNKYNNLQCSSP